METSTDLIGHVPLPSEGLCYLIALPPFFGLRRIPLLHLIPQDIRAECLDHGRSMLSVLTHLAENLFGCYVIVDPRWPLLPTDVGGQAQTILASLVFRRS